MNALQLAYATVLALVLCQTASAQNSGSPVRSVPYDVVQGPVTGVHAKATEFDPATGRFRWEYELRGRGRRRTSATPLATPGQHKAQVNCFNNTLTHGFFTVPTTGKEWMDWAAKKANKTGIVGRFSIGYATNARGLGESGGTGASLGISFYEGTTGFCSRGSRAVFPGGPAAGEDVVILFSGLPGATGSQVSPGFVVTVTLPDNSAFCLPDGKIGWGYIGTEPPLGSNQTGPLLTEFSVNTCWNDAFDLWTHPDEIGSCAGVFFFGGCTPPLGTGSMIPCAGFWLQLWEEEVMSGTATAVDNASNPNNYIITNAPNIGATWSTSIVVNAGVGNIGGVVRFQIAPLFAPGAALGFMVAPTRFMTLVSGSNLIAGGTGLKNFSVSVPKDLGLIGLPLGAQGFGLQLGPFKLEGYDGANYVIGAE